MSREIDWTGPVRILHWLEAEAERADEAAWTEAWKRVHPPRKVAAWTAWADELARDWLGLNLPDTSPPLPENVRLLLKKARPLLVDGR